MKSMQQEKFSQLAMSILLLDSLLPTKAIVLEYFKKESDYLYELFCDKVYEFFNFYYYHKQVEGLVYITDNTFSSQTDISLFKGDHALIYLGTEHSYRSRIKIRFLTPEDVDLEVDDIIYYIDIALERIENYLLNLSQVGEAVQI